MAGRSFLNAARSGRSLAQLISYGITGLIGTGVDFGLFAVLIRAAHWPWFAAGCASFATSVVVTYVISIRIVFSSGVRFKKTDEILLVFLISIIGLALNQALLYLAIHAGLDAILAKILIAPLVIGWNFLARSLFVFRPKTASEPVEL